MAFFTKEEILFQIPDDDHRDLGVKYIFEKMNLDITKVKPEDLRRVKKAVTTLRTKRNKKYVACCRNNDRFRDKHSKWLKGIFKVPALEISTQESCSASNPGRPSMPFGEKSLRSQRREVATISAQHQHDPLRILMAGKHAARRSGEKDLHAIMSEVLKTPTHLTKMRKILTATVPSITQKTPEEALAFILDNSLTKNTYINMRLESKLSGADIWPLYDVVRNAKALCRPEKEAILINENVAEVKLQNLLNHTAKRILDLQAKVVVHTARQYNCTEIEAVLICSWGFDGSTGHSSYQQKYKEATNISGESLFVTTLIPLRLSTSTGVILWNNRTPQSNRFCRPVKIEFVKESQEVILKQKKDIENQIQSLEIFEQFVEECKINIHFSLLLTLIDGKVLNIITNTKSMLTCPICHATPKNFNSLENITRKSFVPDPNTLQYGISPLHAWIRFFECCLHISYRITFKQWQVRSIENKKEFAERKKEIQTIMWDKFGLKVDKPKSGGSGTSNDGNTARRAFSNTDLFADCLGLNRQLVSHFKTILIALSCHLLINERRFEKLCTSTAELYIKSYPWYPMPSTIHKILIHGTQLISTSVLPVGTLGEEASEARNKDYKNFRLRHARKHNHQANLEDVFLRAMDTSDVVISSIHLDKRIKKQNHLPFPPNVVELFDIPEKEPSTSVSTDDTNESEDNGLSEVMYFLNETELSDEE